MAKRIPSQRIRKAVTLAAKTAFTAIRQSHPRETFYVYGLMTNDAAQYLFPVCNTEEGLKKTAKKYKQEGHPEHGVDELRWSFGDWAYADEGEEPFEEVNAILAEYTDFDDVDDDEVEKRVERIMEAVVAGLKDLNDEGFFGTGDERNKVAVMIVGDLDSGLTQEWMRQFNPPAVTNQFEDTATTSGSFREIGSRKSSGCRAVSLTADSSVLVAGGDYHIFAWSLPDLTEILSKRVGAYKGSHWGIHTVAVALDGKELAIGWKSHFNDDGGIERWSIAKPKQLPAPPVLKGGIWSLDYAPHEQTLASGGEDGVIRLWDLKSCEMLREMKGHKEGIERLRYTPNGDYLVSLSSDPEGLIVWDPASGKLLRRIKQSGSAFAMTPDGTTVAVVSEDSEAENNPIQFWNLATGKRVASLKVGVNPNSIAFSSDGTRIAVGGALPGLGEIWDWSEGELEQRLDAKMTSIDDLVFINDDEAVGIVGWSDERRLPLLIWDLD